MSINRSLSTERIIVRAESGYLNFSASGDGIGPVADVFYTTKWTMFWRSKVRSFGTANRIAEDGIGQQLLTTTGGVVQVLQHGLTKTSPSGYLIVGEWHDYCITYDQVQFSFYRDGSLIGTSAITSDPWDSAAPSCYLFNRSALDRNYDGLVREVMIYKARALTQDEIIALGAGAVNDNTNRYIFWKMDEGSGSSVTDSSGNGITGTVAGAVFNTFVFGSTRSAIGTGSSLTYSTTNYITNPSFETNTTGWSASGGATITRVTTDGYSGTSCLKITTDGADGFASKRTSITVNIPTTSLNKRCVVSFYAKAGSLSTASLEFAVGVSTTNFNITSSWARYTVNGIITSTGNKTFYIYSGTRGATGPAGDIYIDAVQVEILDSSIESINYPTNYLDGSLTNCSWSGTANASISTRTTSPEVRYATVLRTAV